MTSSDGGSSIAPSRLGLIGDVHAADVRLAGCLDFLDSRFHPDAILCTGDILDGRGDGERCCQALLAHGALAVRGNHERWLLRGAAPFEGDGLASLSESSLAFVRGLQPTLTVNTAAGALLLCHGVGDDDMVRLTPDDTGYAIESNFALQQILRDDEHRFVVGGHTHIRMVRVFGSLTVVNPGSMAYTPLPGFATLDLDQGEVEFFDVDDGGAVTLAETAKRPAR